MANANLFKLSDTENSKRIVTVAPPSPRCAIRGEEAPLEVVLDRDRGELLTESV
jgi:hypothetical protein